MAGKLFENQGKGQITSGLREQDNLAQKTISFVYQQLPSWRDDPERIFEESERKLNSQLCDFLARCRSVHIRTGSVAGKEIVIFHLWVSM
jgi:hypothetical protein